MAETGHAKNVANFQQMIAYVTGYGVAYDPSNTAIELTALQTKLTEANGSLDDVTDELAPWKVAVNERETAFAGIRALTTRVVNSFAASGAEANAVDDAKTFKRKIDGKRAEALVDDPNTPEDESQGNSVSQQSYTQLVEHLDGLIEILQANPVYNPNENELKTLSLVTYSTDLKAKNAAVADTIVPLSNSRIARDGVLYHDKTGLVALADLVKKYVKSLFGADSPQFEQLSGLKFTTP